MRKSAKWLGNIILGLVILVLTFVFLLPYAFAGCKWIMVLSGSMEPTLQVGGLALARPVDPAVVQVGDIIFYEAPPDPDVMVAHRVIEVLGGESLSFQTKGDASEDPDVYMVRPKDVLGRICFHIPYLGYGVDRLRDLARTRLGFGLLLILPGMLIIGIEVRNISSALNPRKRREERRRERIKGRRKMRLRTGERLRPLI